MKQRITIEQLHELTEEQRERLWEWWKPLEGDVFIIKGTPNSFLQNYIGTFSADSLKNFREKPRGYMPLLSIGQMIELIDNDYMLTRFRQFKAIVTIQLGEETIQHCEDELCDALWKVVKKVI